MASPDTFNRELSLEGSMNFRDLGGLRTADGRMVRTGRLFRSDALHRLTAQDIAVLSRLKIATLIDLRSPAEIMQSGPSPLLERGTRHLQMPVFSRDLSPDDISPDSSLGDLYIKMLALGTDGIGVLFETLSQEEQFPAVIHCAAGKDRTGIVSALILRALGVPDETIVADYALTDRNMMQLVQRMQASGQAFITQVSDDMIRAMPETMETFLRSLDETHGSTSGYLRYAGIDEPVIAAVRDQLLEPATNHPIPEERPGGLS